MTLHIATVSTDQRFYFPYLEASCHDHGCSLTVLGMGETWQGYTWRFEKMMEFLVSLPADDVVCFVDAYDMFCVRPLADLVPRFEEICNREGCKMVVGNDDGHFIGDVIGAFMFGTCRGIRLNAGSYVGRVVDLMDILQQTRERNPGHNDDQILLTEVCNLRPGDIYIDTRDEIFSVCGDMLNEFNKPYDDCFFVHANASSFLNHIIADHGYDMENNKEEIKDAIFLYSLEKFVHHNGVHLKKNIEAVLIYCLTVVVLFSLYLSSKRLWRRVLGWLLIVVAFCTLLLPVMFVGHILMSDYVWSKILNK